MLSNKLPLDPAIPDSLPAVLKRPCDEVLAAAGKTMSDLLLDLETDLAVIKALKTCGKQLARGGVPDAKQEAGTAIYYAAIANSLVFHQHKITEQSYEKLGQAYTRLEQKPWIPSELKNLFKKAEAICQQRKGKT
jgi:hypothetical protein